MFCIVSDEYKIRMNWATKKRKGLLYQYNDDRSSLSLLSWGKKTPPPGARTSFAFVWDTTAYRDIRRHRMAFQVVGSATRGSGGILPPRRGHQKAYKVTTGSWIRLPSVQTQKCVLQRPGSFGPNKCSSFCSTNCLVSWGAGPPDPPLLASLGPSYVIKYSYVAWLIISVILNGKWDM